MNFLKEGKKYLILDLLVVNVLFAITKKINLVSFMLKVIEDNFLGYSLNRKGYNVLNKRTNVVE